MYPSYSSKKIYKEDLVKNLLSALDEEKEGGLVSSLFSSIPVGFSFYSGPSPLEVGVIMEVPTSDDLVVSEVNKIPPIRVRDNRSSFGERVSGLSK